MTAPAIVLDLWQPATVPFPRASVKSEKWIPALKTIGEP